MAPVIKLGANGTTSTLLHSVKQSSGFHSMKPSMFRFRNNYLEECSIYMDDDKCQHLISP